MPKVCHSQGILYTRQSSIELWKEPSNVFGWQLLYRNRVWRKAARRELDATVKRSTLFVSHEKAPSSDGGFTNASDEPWLDASAWGVGAHAMCYKSQYCNRVIG